MQIIHTLEYPTRYVAADNPKCLVINDNKELVHKGGAEIASYQNPMQNAAYPHLTDGLWITLSSYQGKYLTLDYHFTFPNIGRKQVNKSFKFALDEIEAAVLKMKNLIGMS